ncbi:L-serine ammonia-lyase [Temperatibacter marinus]|uniref:L-serine dehydratase n=1 Tax=Temperatibacter marinus TaxID=1456591 RepID=A0AA52HB21_9PROT|nr:L-serine ammonia-lyase [Temperatibacter marinus]WND03320.1 L-serine ammonia-lyase [Temperatibacter marinus]
MISVFDLFNIGIGPSSSHTVGPMRAARSFVQSLDEERLLPQVKRLVVSLYGSLAATGHGHGSNKAIMLGLSGERPSQVDINAIPDMLEHIKSSQTLMLNTTHKIMFKQDTDLLLLSREVLPFHPNGMRFQAFDQDGTLLLEQIRYSIGGGFVVSEEEADEDKLDLPAKVNFPYPFKKAETLLKLCEEHHKTIPEIMMANEMIHRSESEIKTKLMQIWHVMQACVQRGCSEKGEMPGLKIKRRAACMKEDLLRHPEAGLTDPLTVIDWVNLYALAVNEENAAGGRVVTAPTNGAAGIIPAVLHYAVNFSGRASEQDIVDFLLTAAAIGILFKLNASISGAEVGCQGEVGSACAMAAGGLAQILGGSPEQVENAAEIGMEHNLGLTCDPVGGLVQVPCIERNAMASVKAINAARLSLRGDGNHFVSLDKVIRTMRITGRDMQSKYKETAEGGLAHVIPIATNVVDC